MNIANSIQELPKFFDEVYPATLEEMIHVVKYVSNTKNYVLKFEPNLNKMQFGTFFVALLAILQAFLIKEETFLVMFSMGEMHQSSRIVRHRRVSHFSVQKLSLLCFLKQ